MRRLKIFFTGLVFVLFIFFSFLRIIVNWYLSLFKGDVKSLLEGGSMMVSAQCPLDTSSLLVPDATTTHYVLSAGTERWTSISLLLESDALPAELTGAPFISLSIN